MVGVGGYDMITAQKKLQSKIKKAYPPEGKIVRISGKKIYIDLGKISGLEKKDRFEVVKMGEEILDGDGESLGREEIVIGTIKVDSVQDKMSICSVTGKTKLEGDNLIVRFKNKRIL